MTPIPSTAIPIALYIRENVPRPKRFPNTLQWFDILQIQLPHRLRQTIDKESALNNVYIFYTWIKKLAKVDPQAAMNAIWGEK